MTSQKLLNQRFISIEGIEGVGKTTVVEHIRSHFVREKCSHLLTREPGGTPVAEAIRKVLLADHVENLHDDTELLLMFAGRAQNIGEVIKPALAEGKWVISDRFTDASLAYQGAGRGIDVQHIIQLAHWVQAGLEPHYTLLLDAPVDIAMQRIQGRGAKDRIEKEGLDFFERVRGCYLQLAKDYPQRVHVVDASQELSLVLAEVDVLLNRWIKSIDELNTSLDSISR